MKKVNVGKFKEFKVIPEAGKVIGSMERKLSNDYKDFSGLTLDQSVLISEAMDMTYVPYYVNAVANCDERDEFDEKTGLDVCNSKLEYKNHLWIADRYAVAYMNLKKAAEEAYKLMCKHDDKAIKINNDLVEYHGRNKE